MADQKVSALSSLSTPADEDLLLVIDDPKGLPSSKSITLKDLFGAVPSDTIFKSKVEIEGGAVTLASPTAVSSNDPVALGHTAGAIFWDEDFLYIATSNTEIKRVALTTF
jgi:hypothetical protein